MNETDVAVALEERSKLLRLAGGTPSFFRFILGPFDEAGKRIRDLERLREWSWAGTILIRHGVKDAYLVGLNPGGFFFGIGLVDGAYSPGPHATRREGFAYLRFEAEHEPRPIIRVVARLDPLAVLRIGQEESYPFAKCPGCGKISWRIYNHVLECDCGKFEFEGRAFGKGRWKDLTNHESDTNEL